MKPYDSTQQWKAKWKKKRGNAPFHLPTTYFFGILRYKVIFNENEKHVIFIFSD